MRPELEQKLVKRFPVLYQDYSSPMTQTCMCWGFSHDDGWFEIIWQLSLAIEEELGYSWWQKRLFLFKKSFARRWNNTIYKLSPVRRDKQELVGLGTKENPKRWVIVEKAKPTWDEQIVRALFGEVEKIGKFEAKRLGLKRLAFWPDTGFAVQQVKEKFGTLRFYCNWNDQIRKYINLAERLSAVTCEQCGKYGRLTGKSWVKTECEACENKEAA